MSKLPIEITVNGKKYQKDIFPTLTLLEFLRDDLLLTGSKEGCGKGECGTCTVLMDGKPVNSCLVLAIQASGSKIVTIEGLGDTSHLHPVQEAFVSEGGVQCGFCTPGMVVSVSYLLDQHPDPTEDQIKEAISGNICRCTGYTKIVDAVHKAAAIKKAKG